MKRGIQIEVSPGELLDKISILEIKIERIKDRKKLQNIEKELSALILVRNAAIEQSPELELLITQLKETNLTLWCVEEDLRAHERQGYFGASFINLARAVYVNNDQRAFLKRRINELLNAGLVEEKDYQTGMDIA